MKRIITGIIAGALILAAVLFAAGGFIQRYDVVLLDFESSAEGDEIIMDVGISSSMGYTRGFRIDESEGECRLHFYNTFGGLNSSFGAKNRFTLEPEPQWERIWFADRLVLERDENGQWQKAQ